MKFKNNLPQSGGGGARRHESSLRKIKRNSGLETLTHPAFTLAEVLITLSIIGVVAAMTLPALISKYNEFVTINQLKQVYSQLSNAIRMSEAFNGSLKDWDWGDGTQSHAVSVKFAETYILPYLSKKAVKCDSTKNLCFGKYNLFKGLNGKDMLGGYKTSPVYKYNDKTILIAVTNRPSENCPKCSERIKYVNIFVDVNGNKGDAILGKDVFLFTLFNYTYLTGGWVITALCPNGEHYGLHLGSIAGYWGGYCRSLDEMFSGNPGTCNINGTGEDCGLAIEKNGWKIPDKYPIKF